jgi:hypothetical protein
VTEASFYLPQNQQLESLKQILMTLAAESPEAAVHRIARATLKARITRRKNSA